MTTKEDSIKKKIDEFKGNYKIYVYIYITFAITNNLNI